MGSVSKFQFIICTSPTGGNNFMSQKYVMWVLKTWSLGCWLRCKKCPIIAKIELFGLVSHFWALIGQFLRLGSLKLKIVFCIVISIPNLVKPGCLLTQSPAHLDASPPQISPTSELSPPRVLPTQNSTHPIYTIYWICMAYLFVLMLNML